MSLSQKVGFSTMILIGSNGKTPVAMDAKSLFPLGGIRLLLSGDAISCRLCGQFPDRIHDYDSARWLRRPFDRFPGKTRGYGSWTSLCRLFTDFLVEFSAVFFAVASPPRRPASSRVIFRLSLVAITNHSFTVVFAMRICYLPRLICHESKHSTKDW